MKKVLIISLLLSNFSMAQPWVQNYPVVDTITSVGFNVGGCYPNADEKITISTLSVSGMQFGAIISACPANLVYKMPGNDTLQVGDTIPVTGGSWEFYCYAGNGYVTMDFVAYGTPTTAGQTYPCGNLANWLNDLLLCPEGLQNALNNGCSVVSSAGIATNKDEHFNIAFPNPQNNYQLSVESLSRIKYLVISGVDGKVINTEPSAGSDLHISCSTLSSGIYLMRFETQTGPVYRKFSVTR